MKNSNIEWTDHTFNPWEGCTKVSTGCANCYAEARDKRFTGGAHWGKGAPRRRTSVQNWNQVRKWDREAAAAEAFHASEAPLHDEGEFPRYIRPRVFCASLADWLDAEVPIEWLADLLDLVRQTPNLDWLLLTKRPKNCKPRLALALNHITDTAEASAKNYALAPWLQTWLNGEAPANVWLGTTVENQWLAYVRIPELLAIPARVRFLSCEPLLGPLDLVDTPGMNPLHGGEHIDWVIAGGESGPGARPMHPDWARSLRDQCKTAGVAFFFKQWGEWAPATEAHGTTGHVMQEGTGDRYLWIGWDGTTQNPSANGLTQPVMAIAKVGKKAAGRLLDGVEQNAIPEART